MLETVLLNQVVIMAAMLEPGGYRSRIELREQIEHTRRIVDGVEALRKAAEG